MTAKLTEVATQRFVDNVTSITPGVLKGGIASVARHPQRDEIVIGGADGVPKVYRVFRQTPRRIGDDANLIRRLPAMTGRVCDVAVSRDGTRIAAGSGLDGKGQISVYSFEFETGLTDELKKIMSKTVDERSGEENGRLEQYHTQDVKRIADIQLDAAVFAVAFHPRGKLLAAAGADGVVRLFDVDADKIAGQFAAVPLSQDQQTAQQASPPPTSVDQPQVAVSDDESWPSGATLKRLEVEPTSIRLTNRFDYAQLLVAGVLDSGERIDVTRLVQRNLSMPVARLSTRGIVEAVADGNATLALQLAGHSVEVPVLVTGLSEKYQPDFTRDVAPVISKLGCNAGTCHGAAQGKNGFKLSLRGYDPIEDVRAFTDDLASRRTNIASPDDSLMLLKPTAAVPHVGGQLLRPGENRYELIRDWIASGATLDRSPLRVQSLEVSPPHPIIARIGGRQQIRVLATYSDGAKRDVTQEAVITSGNTEVAKADDVGLMTAIRRGEAPVLARFEGSYASTTLTVMGDRTGFVWKEPSVHNRIDELAAAKWKRMQIDPSPLCTDAEFLRRACLDLTGLPPTAAQTRQFLADPHDTKTKRDQLVDRLVGSDEYVAHWTNKWADLLQVNAKYLGDEGAALFHRWIWTEVADNTPYDQFVKKILTATGSNRDNPAASYFKVLRTPTDTAENTTHLFLGVRFNCNKCHDHPFERWTQDQYYEMSAFFAQYELKGDPASGDRKVGGSAVEQAQPLYEVVHDRPEGEVVHIRTGQVTAPAFPYSCNVQTDGQATRRERLAAWLTSVDNPYFARSYVNRLWGYLFGTGIIEPIDDIRAGNPASNPELLDYLTEQFVGSGFNVRHMMRLICQSRTYQLSVATNRWNEDDQINYSHATARRLPAEVLYDAIRLTTGSVSHFPGVPPGTRAAELPDAGAKLPSGFLGTLGGRPVRAPASANATTSCSWARSWP